MNNPSPGRALEVCSTKLPCNIVSAKKSGKYVTGVCYTGGGQVYSVVYSSTSNKYDGVSTNGTVVVAYLVIWCAVNAKATVG